MMGTPMGTPTSETKSTDIEVPTISRRDKWRLASLFCWTITAGLAAVAVFLCGFAAILGLAFRVFEAVR